MNLKFFLASVLVFYTVAAANTPQEGKRLIYFTQANITRWLSVGEIEALPLKNIGFMDITDNPVIIRDMPEADPIPTHVQFESEVRPLIEKVNVQNIADTISEDKGLGQFFNRYYTSPYGKESAEWLYGQYDALIKSSSRTDLKVNYFEHLNWPQQSIVASIEGTDPTKKDDIVIVGGHQDCTTGGATRPCPGADDDASGAATVLEAFRVLAEAGFKPKRTIEFHSYAGEEAGLLGSAAMAAAYKQAGRQVFSMMNFDMTGYGQRIKVVTDFTDKALVEFTVKLIDAYLDGTYPVLLQNLFEGGSDHMSWYRQGYRSSFPFENPYFGQIHTVNDKLEYLDRHRMDQLGRLAVAYVVECSLSV